MIHRGLAVAAALTTFAGSASAQSGSPVSYTVAPVMEGAALRELAVEIRLAEDADGETRLTPGASSERCVRLMSGA